MGGVLVLVAVLVVAYVIVTVGATMYELTGVDKDQARFQALSAFTGAGFTTRISELVVRDPVRRRITSMLIVLGYAGTASIVASLIASFASQSVGSLLINGVVLIGFGAVAAGIVRLFGRVFGDVVRRFLTPRMTGEAVPHEEFVLYGSGFGITRIEIPPRSRVTGKRLRDLDLRDRQLQVLAIEDHAQVHPIPDPDWVFERGQHLILYGRLREVQRAFAPVDEPVDAGG